MLIMSPLLSFSQLGRQSLVFDFHRPFLFCYSVTDFVELERQWSLLEFFLRQ